MITDTSDDVRLDRLTFGRQIHMQWSDGRFVTHDYTPEYASMLIGQALEEGFAVNTYDDNRVVMTRRLR